MTATVALAFVGALVAAWVGATIAYRWDVRRRAVSAVSRAEVIVRRDMQPPFLQVGPNERAYAFLVCLFRLPPERRLHDAYLSWATARSARAGRGRRRG